ncbi:NUDIX domain-containing protein [Crocinitomicaceae bacterium]|nr:NUDIX domain-containing protein [Crocinitomicaceae bacterium]
MYKVFIDQWPLIFTDRDDLLTGNLQCDADRVDTLENIDSLIQKATIEKPLYLMCVNPESTFHRLFEKYILIEAAGGIVQCNDLFLVIKRKGFWDIPKGMVDHGESVESACIREITEECGIRGHQIIEPLTQTYHTMKWNGQDALKKTIWFMLSYTGSLQTSPEQSEGITEAVWMKRNDLLSIRNNTYGSINDVLDAFVANL